MNNYEYSPIADNFLKECHKINQDNVPEVGSRSLEGLTNSIENSDYNECVIFENQVVGFVVCLYVGRCEYLDEALEFLKHFFYCIRGFFFCTVK